MSGPGTAAFQRRRGATLAILLAVAGCATPASGPAGLHGAATLWRFDNLQRIGGAGTSVEGGPELVASEHGPAIRFNGVDDALFIADHPLAGAATFTAEAIVRPLGGAFEQRWLHLAEAGGDAVPQGADPPVPPGGPRIMFELRVVGDRWYLDAFTAGPGYNKPLIVPDKTFPVGRWYHVAQTYDGRTYRSYVDGVLQAEAQIAFRPQGAGCSAIGTRINRRDYFHGDVLAARFTPAALAPGAFMKLPR